MLIKRLSRVLTVGLIAGLLPACFSNSPTRLTQAPLPAPVHREPRAQAPASRLPYAYNSVVPYAQPKKPPAVAAAKPAEKIVPPPLDLPIEPIAAAATPKLELETEPIGTKIAQTVAKTILMEFPKSAGSDHAADPPLVAALRLCCDKRAGEALSALKAFDPLNQEALLTLLPITVRMSEGSLNHADPQEIAIILDQLQSLILALQPKAALKLDKLSFCKNIRKFGVYDAIEGKPSFRAGDMVEIYGELRNLSCARNPARPNEYRTHTTSTLDIREMGGNSGWRKEVPKVDMSHTAPNDFYHHYRFQLPELAPGPYLLSVEVQDMATGRKVRQNLEFRVMP